MRDFYEKFYQAVQHSAAHSLFCERSFGRDLCQHGFADMAQIDALIAATGLAPGDHALDLGCGNGMIAEYISDSRVHISAESTTSPRRFAKHVNAVQPRQTGCRLRLETSMRSICRAAPST